MKWKKFLPVIVIICVLIFFIKSISGKKEDQKSIFSNLSKKESANLQEFLNELLLREEGIYVLHGSKPLITVWLPLFTEEELIEREKNLSEEERKSGFKIPIINYSAIS